MSLLEKLLFCQVIFQWAADYPSLRSPLYLSDKHRTIAVNTDVYFSKSTNLYDKTTETLANKYVATPAVYRVEYPGILFKKAIQNP